MIPLQFGLPACLNFQNFSNRLPASSRLLGPRRVIKDGWFLFDSTLVIIAYVEQFIELFSNGQDSGYEQQAHRLWNCISVGFFINHSMHP